jgi:hypothetical protein
MNDDQVAGLAIATHTINERLNAIEKLLITALTDLARIEDDLYQHRLHSDLHPVHPTNELPEDGATPKTTNSGTPESNLEDFPSY